MDKQFHVSLSFSSCSFSFPTGLSKPKLKHLLLDIKTSKWFLLGLTLTDDEPAMNLIRHNCRQDAQEALTRTFELWLETEQPTWKKMVLALQQIGENNLASRIIQKYC